MRYVLWLWASLSDIAYAEEPPKYLLRDAGVRVDLTSEWRASEWTPDHLQADRVDGKAKLYAWSTPGQLEIVPADLPGWAHVYEAMLGNLKAKDPALKSSEVKTLGGRPTARIDLVFEESGRKGIAATAKTGNPRWIKYTSFYDGGQLCRIGHKAAQNAAKVAYDESTPKLPNRLAATALPARTDFPADSAFRPMAGNVAIR